MPKQYEVYQIGKCQPIPIVADKLKYDVEEPQTLDFFIGDECIASFVLRNIAGYKVINND